MGVDRTSTGADDPGEAAQEPSPPDSGPPPDRPGAEGVPSRADSRNGAVSASETSNEAAEDPGEDKPDAQARQETTDREDNTTVENKPETHGTSASDEGLSNDDGNAERYNNYPMPEDTQAPPHDSIDAPADVTSDETPERALSADDTTEATPGPPEVESQSELTDNKPSKPPEEIIPGSEASWDGERKEAGEAGEQTGLTPPESEEGSGPRTWSLIDESDIGDEAKSGGEDAAVWGRTVGERLMVDDKPLREYLDPVGTAAWSNDLGDQAVDPDDRMGGRIAKTENDENSRTERLRRKFHREGTDSVEDAGKAASHVKDVLLRLPTGHMETRTGPTMTSAPHDGAGVTDTFTATVAAVVMIGEAGRLVHRKFFRRKADSDGGNR